MRSAKAQSEVWVLGDQWVRTGTSNAVLPLQALPQPGGAGNYAGQVATRSSTARADASGNLLFFAVDGNFYNGQGYRIADAEGIGCVQCVPKGHSEVLVLPVPGSCWLYYVVTVRIDFPGEGYTVLTSILDMRADVTVAACAKGRMLNADDLPDAGGPYDQFHDWFFSGAGFEGNEYQKIVSNLSDPEEEAGYVSMAAMDPGWANGDLLLHITTDRTVHQYRVTAAGIYASWNQLIEPDHVFNKELTRDTDFGRDELTGDILFAATDVGLWIAGEPQNAPSYRALVLRMDAATGEVLETEGYLLYPGLDVGSLSDGTNGPYSCSFSPDGQKLYFTGDFIGLELGVIDRITGVVTDLTDLANLGITGPTTWARTRLSHGKAPGGVEDAIYFAKSTGLAALVSPNNPATATWNASVGFSNGLNGIPVYVDPFDAGTPTCILMDALIAGDQHSATLTLAGACCEYMSEVYAECEYTYSGNNSTTPWTVANNGFLDPDNNGEILFAHDYVVQPGAQLSVSGMTLRFAPAAHLIIKPGGRARFQNCTLTSYVCDGLRWKGIRVNGTTSEDQTPIIGGDQGFLQLVNTTVSNAEVGSLCATELPGGGIDVNGFGGIVYAYSGTTFKNNLIGADLGHYHEHDNNQGVEDNRSYFTGCHFVTDSDWPDVLQPQWQLVIQDTRKVDVTFCSFANDAPQLFPADMPGYGLLIGAAEVKVTGNGNPAQNYVRNLRIGILNTNYLNTPVTVEGMHFEGNVWGLADFATLFGRYVNNTFSIPDQAAGLSPRVGMLLWQSQLYTVERNSFQGENAQVEVGDNAVGVMFLGYYAGLDPYDNSWVYIDNQIYDNTFLNMEAANLVRWIHRGHAAGTNDAGLQMLCGDYTNNTFDQALLDQSIIKPTQGFPFDAFDPQLGGNQYLDQAGCTTDYDWYLDPLWNQIPDWYPDMTVTYWHHQAPLITIRPSCEFDGFEAAEADGSGTFNKPLSCGKGILDTEDGISEVVVHLNEAKELWADAQAALDGLVNAEDESTLLQVIEDENHPWTSSALRNLLLASSPVSDRVLTAAIERYQPLDPWHLTQVLTENSRLNTGIYALVQRSEQLSPFYMGLVTQAQNGAGPSTKQQLEEEVSVRRMQRTQAIAALGWLYGTDTTLAYGADSLRSLVMNTGDEQFAYQRLQTLLAEQNWSAVQTELLGPAGKLNGSVVYQQLAWYGHACGGDWSQLTTAQKNNLVQLQSDGRSGAAFCAGVLKRIAYTDAMPPVILPRIERAQLIGHELVNAAQIINLSAYPNPAADRTMVTWPISLKNAAYELRDLMGRLLLSGRFIEQGITEFDLRELPAGSYDLLVVGTDEHVRFVVNR